MQLDSLRVIDSDLDIFTDINSSTLASSLIGEQQWPLHPPYVFHLRTLIYIPLLTPSIQLAYKHWQRIIRLWPTDLVRPKTVSFQHLMQQRLSKIHPPSTPKASTPNAAAESIKSNEALVTAVPPSSSASWDEAHQMRQVNVLYSLLENRYLNANPTPQSLRKPRSDPEHYDVLIREMEEAPRRTWFGSLWKRVTGSVRISQ